MKNQFKCKVTEDRSVGDIPRRHEVGILPKWLSVDLFS